MYNAFLRFWYLMRCLFLVFSSGAVSRDTVQFFIVSFRVDMVNLKNIWDISKKSIDRTQICQGSNCQERHRQACRRAMPCSPVYIITEPLFEIVGWFGMIFGWMWDRFGENFKSILDRLGVGLGSIWDRFRFGLGSVWGECGVHLGSVQGRCNKL